MSVHTQAQICTFQLAHLCRHAFGPPWHTETCVGVSMSAYVWTCTHVVTCAQRCTCLWSPLGCGFPEMGTEVHTGSHT